MSVSEERHELEFNSRRSEIEARTMSVSEEQHALEFKP